MRDKMINDRSCKTDTVAEYKRKWSKRKCLTNRVTERAIQNFIVKTQPTMTKTIHYDKHPTDGFVAYIIIE